MSGADFRIGAGDPEICGWAALMSFTGLTMHTLRHAIGYCGFPRPELRSRLHRTGIRQSRTNTWKRAEVKRWLEADYLRRQTL